MFGLANHKPEDLEKATEDPEEAAEQLRVNTEGKWWSSPSFTNPN